MWLWIKRSMQCTVIRLARFAKYFIISFYFSNHIAIKMNNLRVLRVYFKFAPVGRFATSEVRSVHSFCTRISTGRWVDLKPRCNGYSGKEKIHTATTTTQPSMPKPGKMSYLSVQGTIPLLGNTVGDLLDQAVERFGEREGLVVSDINLRRTFKELKTEIDNLAAGFLALGLERGDRVGNWGPNSHPYYITQMAAWKAGLILVNINSANQPDELLYCLKNVGVKCLVVAENFKTQNYYEMAVQVVPEILTCPPGKTKSKSAPDFQTLVTMGSTRLKGALNLSDIMANGASEEAKELLSRATQIIQFDDICNIQFTSGTTGNPKGTMLSHHNIVNNSYFIRNRFLFTEHDKICLTVPMFHCYGCVIGALVALHCGATCVFPAAAFTGQASIEAAAKEKCTILYGTPTMHIAMMNIPDFKQYDLSSLRFAATAGAICPEELIREMKEKYTVDTVGSMYGMTETSPVFFQSLPEDSDALRSGTVGYPMEHCEVKIVDPEENIVPVGMPGEMCVRGFMTMQGYWGDKEKTGAILKSTKWLHTGDMMVMLESGHAAIVGRLKDTIIRGGENIYPKEVEEFLHTHPKIMEAQVFGEPDKLMGEIVAAWVVLKDGHMMTEQEVKDFCKGKIAHYKVPAKIAFVSDFPKTTSGKIQKFRMRESGNSLYER